MDGRCLVKSTAKERAMREPLLVHPTHVAIPFALHDALISWADTGFDDFGDFFFDLVQAAADAGYGQMPDGGVTGLAYDRTILEEVPF